MRQKSNSADQEKSIYLPREQSQALGQKAFGVTAFQ